MIRNSFTLIINYNIIFELLRYMTTTIVDIYTISRSLKIFSLTYQSNNLNVNSLCYNEFGPTNRNIIYYHGYLHTRMYYIFWRYFFNRHSDFSIKRNNNPTYDFNFIFNNKLISQNIRGGINYTLESINDFNTELNFIVVHHYLLDIFNVKNFHAVRRLYNNNFIDNNNIVTYDNIQCIGNFNNILKKILINISKSNKERDKLFDQINNKYTISTIKSNLIIDLSKIILNNFRNNNNYNITLTTNFPLINGNMLLSLPDYMILHENNIYTPDTFRNHMINNNFPQMVDNLLVDNKRELESIATKFFTYNFLHDDITRITFVDFIIKIYNSTIKSWLDRRIHNILALNRLAFNIPPAQIIDQTIVNQYTTVNPLVYIIYKGGMPLKILYSQIKKQFTIDIENFLDSNYKDEFNLSDNDFSININIPYIYENGISRAERDARIQLYTNIYNEISLLNYIIIRDITNIFNDPAKNKLLFSFYKHNNTYQRNLLQKLLNNINKKINEKIINSRRNGTNYSFNNLQNSQFNMVQAYNDVVYPPEQFDLLDNSYVNLLTNETGTNANNNNRKGIILINNLVPLPANNADVIAYYNNINATPFIPPPVLNPANTMTVKHIYNSDIILDNIGNNLYNKSTEGPFYSSYNAEIIAGINKFNLSRIKYNFRLYGVTNRNNIFVNIPAEVVDISIANDIDNNIYMNLDVHTNIYQDYKIINNNKIQFKYKSYSLSGFIYDLERCAF